MKRVALLFAALLAYTGLAFAVVNVNSATKEQLEKLEGIGPVKAQAIIDYRKKNGPFKKLEDVKNVDGIGEATFATIRKDIALSGTTTGPGKAAEKKADSAADKAEKKVDKAADKADKKAADAKATAKDTAVKAEKKVDKAADKATKKVDAAADKADKKVEEKKK
jgi:competence protein ComEA